MRTKLLILFYIFPVCLMAQSHYKIYSTSEHKTVDVNDIVNHMDKADVLFFGEEHNDSIGHTIELALLQKLNTKYPSRTALSMEMFESDCQTVVNEYLAGQISEKYLISDARVWPNYKIDYRPLVELAKANHLSVIAANAPGRYVNMTNRLGLSALAQLSLSAKAYLPPLPIDTATGAYYNKFSQLMGGHGSMGGMQLYQAQNVWDATMGWFIAQFYKSHTGYKILQINGGFHSEDKLGTVSQLNHYAPKAKVLTVGSYADAENFANPDWTKYQTFADYIVLTDFKLSEEQ